MDGDLAGALVFVLAVAALTALYLRMLLRRLDPAALRRQAQAASAYRMAMGRRLDVDDAERRIRRLTKANIVAVATVAAAVCVAQVVAGL